MIYLSIDDFLEACMIHMGQLIDIVGEASIDIVPRILYFAGTKECCKAWRDAKYGIEGLLAVDDSRYS